MSARIPERAVRYKGLMIVCCRSLLSNSTTDDDIDDVRSTHAASDYDSSVRDAGADRFTIRHVALYTLNSLLHGR